MAQETGYSDYRSGVEAIASSVIERARAGEDPYDVLHEEVEGSWWIIYTHAAIAVLAHSRNDDEIFEQRGSDALTGCNSMAEVYALAAYYALQADVLAELHDDGYDLSDPDTFAVPEDDAAE
jgi:hypothetical protein